MIFNFEHMFIDTVPGKKCFFHRDWKLTELKAILGGWMSFMQEHDGWDSLYIENHDQPRIIQRWASSSPEYREASAKMLAIFHATGRGTLFLYQGQEIGTANSASWRFDELRDLEEINFYNYEKSRRPEGADMSDVLAGIQRNGRDNARMPMAWNSGINAGFSSGTPWIKVNEDYKEWNVSAQEGVEGSVFEFWRKLLSIRKKHLGLVYGWLKMIDEANEEIYAYTRTDDEAEYLVVCSFSGKDVEWKCPVEKGELLLGSHHETIRQESADMMQLRAYEGRLYHRKL